MDRKDRDHDRARAALSRSGLRLYVPALVLAEVLHFVGQRLGSEAEASFLAGLGRLSVVAPQPEEWTRIAELVRTYRDVPLGGVDASVVSLAERLGTDLLITLDRRHFSAIRPHHVVGFRILPE
jgi:predicted nucleic acid-binding protein